MSYTMISSKRYTKECDKGTQMCIMCGQWNKNTAHRCWYCGAREIVSFSETGSVRPTTQLPVIRADGSYEVDTMIVNSHKEFEDRVEAFKEATTDNMSKKQYIKYLMYLLDKECVEYKPREEPEVATKDSMDQSFTKEIE